MFTDLLKPPIFLRDDHIKIILRFWLCAVSVLLLVNIIQESYLLLYALVPMLAVALLAVVMVRNNIDHYWVFIMATCLVPQLGMLWMAEVSVVNVMVWSIPFSMFYYMFMRPVIAALLQMLFIVVVMASIGSQMEGFLLPQFLMAHLLFGVFLFMFAARLTLLVRDLRALSTIDELTGLPNRRFLIDRLEEMVKLKRRQPEQHYVLAMLDIDHFKQVNDQFGHVTGDRVLREFSDKIRLRLRETDLFCRYGGEEFVLCMPVTGMQAAVNTIDKIRESIAETLLVEGHHVTFSAGVSELGLDEDVDEWVHNCDRGLYLAKREGRNCVRAC